MKKRISQKAPKKTKSTVLPDKRIALIGVLILVCITLTLSLYAGSTYAKYKENWSNGAVASAQNFYFESNLLSEGGTAQSYSPGNITFDLYNFADSLRTTGAAIAYSVAVDNGIVTSVKSGTDDVSGSSYTMNGNAAATHNVTITPTDTNKAVTITVTASAPYSKTLTATFNPTVAPTCTITDSKDSVTAQLNFLNLSDSASITVKLPTDTNLIPDIQDSRVTNYSNNSFTFSAEPGSSSVTLFKKVPATVYKLTDSSITNSTVTISK